MKDDSSDSAKRPEAGFEQRLDQNDAEAYLDAESVLTDAQRAQAREIAEHYREQLFEWREARRASAKSGDRPSPRSSPTPP